MWEQCSKILAPPMDLLRICGQTKDMNTNDTRKDHLHWNGINQEDFENIKNLSNSI